MMELLINECTCTDEVGRTYTFHYYLLQEDSVHEAAAIKEYGVMIRSSSGEQASVPNITPDRLRIGALLELLICQAVSPVHLWDVLDDWL